MPHNDLEAEIDTLAMKVEQQIAATDERIEEFPDFKPRSNRAVRMRNGVVMNGK